MATKKKVAKKAKKVAKKAKGPSLSELSDSELFGKAYEALIWCSGSGDFGKGGVARRGWLKLCKPLLEELPDRIKVLKNFDEFVTEVKG